MTKPRPPWRDMFGLALAGAIGGLGHPPFSYQVLTIAALGAAFFMFCRTARHGAAWWLGLAFGTGYFAVSLHWIVEPFFVDPWRHGWMAPFAILFLSVGLALFWGAAFGAAKALKAGSWVLIVTWTAAELVRAYVFTGFPWAMPSYVLVNQWAGQGAAWIGPHGLNLCVFLLAWGISRFLMAQGRARVVLGVVVALAFGGLSRTLPAPEIVNTDAPVMRMVQPNAPQHLKWHPDFIGLFFDRALAATAAGDVRPDLIVWPESSVPVALNDARNTLAVVAEAAQGTPVVLGINRFEGARVLTSAIVLDDGGAVGDVYDKHHLVPFGEYVPLGDLAARVGLSGFAARDGQGFSAGPGPGLLDLGALGMGLPLICYEAVFPQDVTGAPSRPDMLIQITNDAWFGNFSGPYQHLDQARMRAIEMGVPMLRAANTGVSAVIDARGRIVGSLPLNTDGYLDTPLPEKRPETLYSRTGDLPVALLLILLIGGLTLRAWRNSD